MNNQPMEAMKLRRYIEAPRDVRVKAAQELGITEAGIALALSFDRDGEKSRKAREMVLANGEAQVMCYLPECETIHDADGVMRQVFPNGYTIEVIKATGVVLVYDSHGELRSQDFNPSITEFSALQCKVENSQP